MKRSTHRSRPSAQPPVTWREAEYAAVQANAADSYDDRVFENMFDAEDERAEIDSIMHRQDYEAN
jgi:hypothetical protein